jgi:tRNA G18 (ribose-2'-O)-methylase SpoU
LTSSVTLDRSNATFLNSLDSPDLLPYLNLRNQNWTSVSGIFVAEGPLLVERLIQSDYSVRSALLDQKYLDHYADQIPDEVKLLVVPHDLVQQIVGFNFHRGLLACGIRKPINSVAQVATQLPAQQTWLGLVGVQDPENVGGMLRTAAGLGIQNVVIGPGTADPLSRRSLRVSMGQALKLNLYLSRDLPADLQLLKRRGVECLATSLGDSSQPLERAHRHGPVLLLMGNERHGLPKELLVHCDRQVRIDMSMQVDSLNVGVAAGIVMHHFCRIATLSGSLGAISPVESLAGTSVR